MGGAPNSCPVAILARENAALGAAHDAADDAAIAIRKAKDPEAAQKIMRLERQGEAISARRVALQSYAANLPATSAEGALFQLGMIANLVDTLFSWLPEKGERRKELEREEAEVQMMLRGLVAYVERSARVNLSDTPAACMFEEGAPHAEFAEAIARAVAA